MKSRLPIDDYKDGILQGDRFILAKAITLVESTLGKDRELAIHLLQEVEPRSGQSIRIGITGVPGVGKSTFIERFGLYLIKEFQKKVAVLTVDPSSRITKGSILGDKTRMDLLSKNSNAFIRPSASGETLGGITNRTREAIVMCEAAGFDIIIVETVGIGQSEIAVKNTVDFFILLLLAGAGDSLQGIKRGVMEMANTLMITKADGENTKHATQAQADYQHALHLFRPDESGWNPTVEVSSALENKGFDTLWDQIGKYIALTKANGYFENNRRKQRVDWLHECVNDTIKNSMATNDQNLIKQIEEKVLTKKLSPWEGAQQIIKQLIRIYPEQ